MDLGIKGKTALVCASSRGLGKACANALAREGVNVVMNGRNPETLAAAANEVRKVATGAVETICADITTEEGRQAALTLCPAPDILVNNAGGPPPGNFRDWQRDDWIGALDANMLTPIELMKATIDGMCERGFGRIVNITSSSVKAPIGVLGLSNGARAGLTGFVAGLAREVSPKGVTVNAILPGPFHTDRLRSNLEHVAKSTGVTYDEEFARRSSAVPVGRFGEPAEFGELCAFLCSQHAAYITGQNILIDGGNYPGTL